MSYRRLDDVIEDILTHDVVSFDVFDTLLVRPFIFPHHVFNWAELKATEITQNPYLQFPKMREDAYAACREEMGAVAVHLDAVYDKARELNLYSKEVAEALRDLEKDAELQCCYRRESAYRLYETAKHAGKKVIFISDMYLPTSVVCELLKTNGYEADPENVYVSCDYKKGKFNKALYEHALEDLGIKPEQMIHVGDSHHSDVKMAEELGIKGVFFPKTSELFRSNVVNHSLWRINDTFEALAQSVYLGMVANRLYDDPFRAHPAHSLFSDSFYYAGYYGLGPMLFAFAKWLVETSIADGKKDLYFLSREGRIFKQAYDLVAPFYDKAPKSHYILASRRASCVAQLETREDVFALSSMRFVECRLADLLSSRYGINPAIVSDEAVKKAGFRSIDEVVDMHLDREHILSLLEEIYPLILANAADERKRYLDYLDGHGMVKGKKVAIVDIGYNGSTQTAFNKMMHRTDIAGYYLVTFPDAYKMTQKGIASRGFLSEYEDYKSIAKDEFCRTVEAMEFFLCGNFDQKSFVKFAPAEKGKKPEPVFVETEKPVHELEDAHEGALDFTRQLVALFAQDIKRVHFNRGLLTRVFVKAFDQNHGTDRSMLENLAMDDSFKCYRKREVTGHRPKKQGNTMEMILNDPRLVWKRRIRKAFTQPHMILEYIKFRYTRMQERREKANRPQVVHLQPTPKVEPPQEVNLWEVKNPGSLFEQKRLYEPLPNTGCEVNMRQAYDVVSRAIRDYDAREVGADALAKLVQQKTDELGLKPFPLGAKEKKIAQEFKREGVVRLPFNVLSEQEIDELNAYLKDKPIVDFYNKHEVFTLDNIPKQTNIGRYTADFHVNCPHVMKAATHPSVLAIAEEFLGAKPTMSVLMLMWSFANGHPAQHMQKFHRDNDDYRFCKLFILMNDVDDEEDGPHLYIQRTQSQAEVRKVLDNLDLSEAEKEARMQALFAGVPNHRYEDELIESTFPKERFMYHLGKKGTCIMEDTWGIHRGIPPKRKHRLILQVQYSLQPTPMFSYTPNELKERCRFTAEEKYVNRLYVR